MGETAHLTLLIDTNRMLRFENGGRDERPVIFDGWTEDRAYFINSIFNTSTVVFVGKPGDIRGNSWTATSCAPKDKPNPSDTDYSCALGQSYESWLVDVCLTIIKQSDGTLTVIKGNNIKGVENNFAPDTSYYSESSELVTLKYSLGQGEGEGVIKTTLPNNIDDFTTGNFHGF